MARDFFPRRDSDAVSFTKTLSAALSQSPELYKIKPEIAAQYAILQQEFAEAFLATQSKGTDSSSMYDRKRDARAVLENRTRWLVSIIKSDCRVSDALLAEAGVKRNARRRRQTDRPGSAPLVDVVSVKGCVVQVRLRDAETGERKKARDVVGANIYAFVGENPPKDLQEWIHTQQTSSNSFMLIFDPSLAPWTKVWMTAQWYNGRGEAGPVSAPISTNLLGGPHDAASLIARAPNRVPPPLCKKAPNEGNGFREVAA